MRYIVRQIRQWMNQRLLIHKLIFIIVVIVLIPMMFISTLVYKTVYEKTVEEQEVLRKANLTNVISSTEIILKEYEKTMDHIYDYDEILRAAYQNENWTTDKSSQNMLSRVLGEIRKSQEFIGSIAFVFQNGSSIHTYSSYGRYLSIEEYNRQHTEEFILQLEEPYVRAKWEQSLQGVEMGSNYGKPLICVSKPVKNIYDKNTPLGILVLHISTTALEQVPALKENGKEQMLLITDSNHQVVWKSKSVEERNMKALEQISEKITKNEQMKLTFYQDEYYVISKTSDMTGWNYINLIPKKEIFSSLHIISLYFTGMIVLLVLTTILCVLLLNNQIFKPIRKLIVFMNQIDALEKIPINIPTQQNNEIGYLYQTYNRLNERIYHLIKELEEMCQEDKNKEIKLLQSQLNPHFIYNTLESIGWVAYVKNVPEITQVLTCLSNILRYSIKHNGKYVTLGKELEMLKQYVYIQHFRFEDRFSIKYEINEALLEYCTIKFIFQPFVENALVHGFKNMENGCEILVKLFDAEEDIGIEISDNGCGMSSYQLEHIRQQNTDSIGIYNVDKALRLRYGNRYRIKIDTQVGKGTVIKLRIPKLK